VSQNSPKNTVPSQLQEGSELPEESAAGLQVVRPAQTAAQLPKGPSNQQIGQGIVPPNVQARAPGPLLNSPEDISSFFRNRQMVVQGSLGINPVLKFFMFFCVMTGSFIVSWNYIGQFRKITQAMARDHLAISLAEYVPVWTKRAKKFEHSVDREIAVRPIALKPGASVSGPIEPIYLSVVAGFWPQVDSLVTSKCNSWEASSGCSLKAWFYSYKGLHASLRAILKINPDSIKNLSTREQAVFRFAMASVTTGIESEKLFQDSMTLIRQDHEFSRMLFDARFKQILRENRKSELPSMIKMAKEMSSGPSDISRWRSLEIAARFSSFSQVLTPDQKRAYSKQILETLQQYPGTFKSDPVAFISIANFGLRLGLARNVSAVAVPLGDEALKANVDLGLRRELFLASARALMLEGDATKAAQRVVNTLTRDGADGVSSHLLGSIYLEMRSSARLPEAIKAFQAAIKSRNAWQSHAGLLMALQRAGNLKDAGHVAKNLSTSRTKENEAWILLALAQYRLALAHASGSASPARYKEIADSIAWIHSKHPDWPGLAKSYAEALVGSGQAGEAQKIRMSIDDMSTKTSYLSSREFLESPIGPFGLMR
jgi:hypothetical protein